MKARCEEAMLNEWEKEKEKTLKSLLGGGQELASLPTEMEVSNFLFDLTHFLSF